MESSDQSIIGTKVDNYEITAILGRGGMGVVYKARNVALEKDVALKVMDANLARDESFLKRFKVEAQSLARLQNANIVTVYDLRETPLGFLIVMEFVDGVTLAEKIRGNGPLSITEALPIFRQLLGAIQHAHEAGVVHRDIKPSNIMVTADGVVKVTDFGLAKIQHQSSATLTMASGGTLRYMPPEQIRGLAEVDHRGDIYSLGMTLYEAVAGKLPFEENESDYAISAAIVEGKISRPDRINPSITKELVKVIMQAIAKDPAERFQSVAEMEDAMSRVERQLPTAVSGDKVHIRRSPRTNRFRSKTVVVVASLIVIIAGAVFVFLTYHASGDATASITSYPVGATVELNGQPLGVTPIKITKLVPGISRLRFTMAGFMTRDTSFAVASGANLSVLVPLVKLRDSIVTVESHATAKLSLKTIPAGSVTVDGHQSTKESGGWSEFDIEPGQHTISFSRGAGGSKIVDLTLQAGETRRLTCYFESYVSILARPVWASIIIDGKEIGKITPQAAIPLPVGKHRVSVSRMGYELIDGARRVDVYPSLEKREIPLVFNLQKN